MSSVSIFYPLLVVEVFNPALSGMNNEPLSIFSVVRDIWDELKDLTVVQLRDAISSYFQSFAGDRHLRGVF